MDTKNAESAKSLTSGPITQCSFQINATIDYLAIQHLEIEKASIQCHTYVNPLNRTEIEYIAERRPDVVKNLTSINKELQLITQSSNRECVVEHVTLPSQQAPS